MYYYHLTIIGKPEQLDNNDTFIYQYRKTMKKQQKAKKT